MCSNCLKVLSFCLNRTDIFAENPTEGGLSEPRIIALNSILSEFFLDQNDFGFLEIDDKIVGIDHLMLIRFNGYRVTYY